MKNLNLKEIEKLCESFNNDLSEIEKNLKRVQCAKSRLLPQKGRPDYEQVLNEILGEEQMLKEAKRLLKPKKKTCMELTKNDIEMMTFDEVKDARNAIASQMSRTRWLTTIEGDNDKFRQATKIDEMLIERLKVVKPIEDTVVRKSDIQLVIDTIKASGNLSNERIIEMLEGLI